MMEPWIITNSGKKFNLVNPIKDMVNIKDIAHALSNICRFGGHCNQHYSVAQHCVIASMIVSEENALCALLHDATEAYIGDMVSPLKQILPQFKEIEQNLWKVIADKYNLPYMLPEEVKTADLKMLKAEKRDIMPLTDPWPFLEGIKETSMYISPWDHEYARARFINRFKELGGK